MGLNQIKSRTGLCITDRKDISTCISHPNAHPNQRNPLDNSQVSWRASAIVLPCYPVHPKSQTMNSNSRSARNSVGMMLENMLTTAPYPGHSSIPSLLSTTGCLKT